MGPRPSLEVVPPTTKKHLHDVLSPLFKTSKAFWDTSRVIIPLDGIVQQESPAIIYSCLPSISHHGKASTTNPLLPYWSRKELFRALELQWSLNCHCHRKGCR